MSHPLTPIERRKRLERLALLTPAVAASSLASPAPMPPPVASPGTPRPPMSPATP